MKIDRHLITRDPFLALVTDMRAAQREYFRMRTPSRLAEARRLEKQVDHWIECEAHPRAEPTLFDRAERVATHDQR